LVTREYSKALYLLMFQEFTRTVSFTLLMRITDML
jgi:hypothetical protein